MVSFDTLLFLLLFRTRTDFIFRGLLSALMRLLSFALHRDECQTRTTHYRARNLRLTFYADALFVLLAAQLATPPSLSCG